MLVSQNYENDANVLEFELDRDILRFIDGSRKKKKHSVGYCNCDDHPGCLTKKMMSEHDCNGKGCKWLYMSVDFDKEEKKQKRRIQIEKRRKESAEKEKILTECRNAAFEYEGMKIMDVEKDADSLIVKYLAIAGFDRQGLETKLIDKTDVDSIEMIPLEYDFETAADIIYG